MVVLHKTEYRILVGIISTSARLELTFNLKQIYYEFIKIKVHALTSKGELNNFLSVLLKVINHHCKLLHGNQGIAFMLIILRVL